MQWSITALIVSFVYGWLTGGATYAGLVADDAVYLLMADYFSPFTRSDFVHHYLASVNHLPPLLPITFAYLGIGSEDMVLAHWFQSVCIGASTAVIGIYAQRLSNNRYIGLLAGFTFAISSATVLLSVEILSEFLFILLVYSAFATLARDKLGFKQLATASLLLGLAAITRGFGLIALAALCASSLYRYPKWLPLVVILGTSPLILCSLLGLDGAGSYIEIFSRRVNSFDTLLATIQTNVGALWNAWTLIFDRSQQVVTVLISGVLIALSFCCFIHRVKRAEIDSLYIAGYIALMLIWPFPTVMERLLFPLAPLLIIYALTIANSLGYKLLFFRWRYVASVLALLLIAPMLQSTGKLIGNYIYPPEPPLHYLAASRNWMSIDNRELATARLAQADAIIKGLTKINELLPAQACIYSERPQITMFYTRRPSYPAPLNSDSRSAPKCRYHLLINDSSLQQSYAKLWPSYKIIFTHGLADKPIVLLASYADLSL